MLSSGKYRRLVNKAKAHGFEVRLIYVYLQTAEMQLERIRIRVEKGGHDVREAKVRDRRLRSIEQLGWFFEASDYALVYDNSGAEPQLMARKEPGRIRVSSGIPIDIAAALTLGPAEDR